MPGEVIMKPRLKMTMTAIALMSLVAVSIMAQEIPGGQGSEGFDQREIDLRLIEKPIVVHSKQDGWAELPAILTTPQYTYVTYDVRQGYKSHLYLARISRDDGEVEKIQIDQNGEIEFQPSITARGDGLWIAWTSYRDDEWAIRAGLIDGLMVVRKVTISEGDGLVSHPRLAVGDGKLAVAWMDWKDRVFAVKARFLDDSGDDTLTIYASTTSVARPDIGSLGDGRWVFVWDEFINGHYVTRMRELTDGRLGSVGTLSSQEAGNSWEPHVAANAEGLLVTWHRVPRGSDRTQPALTIPGVIKVEDGIDRERDDETWRVQSFTSRAGDLWIAWVTRRMCRSTQLFLRKVGEGGLSQICKLEFRMPKNFINWFDMELDRFAAIAWEYSGSIYYGEFKLPRLKIRGIPEKARFETVSPPQTPEPVNYSISYAGDVLKVYFGDYHNHTSFSDGRAYPDISMNFARYRRGLDFFCITDHDVTLTPGEFVWTRAVAKALSDEGQFVCLHGYEPSKGWAQHKFGHWNMLYFDGGDVFQYQEGMTPHDLQAYAKAHDAVLVPHHVAKKFAPYAWDYFDEVAQPVVEMCSIHGVFEMYEGHEDDRSMVEGKFIQDGLGMGHKFGFVGASDYHNCFGSLLEEYGLTGLYATSLTLEGIHEALKKRRTFALTGGRIIVDFRCNGHLMGEEIEGGGNLTFSTYAASSDTIATVEIISWGKPIYEQQFNQPEVRFEYKTVSPPEGAYYYLRVRTAKGDFAWSSPIWIVPSGQ